MFCLDFLEILEEAASGFLLRTGTAHGSKQRLFPMGKKSRQVSSQDLQAHWGRLGAAWGRMAHLCPQPSVCAYRLDLKHQEAIEGFGVGCDLDRAENFRRIEQSAVFAGREQGGMSIKSYPCPPGVGGKH